MAKPARQRTIAASVGNASGGGNDLDQATIQKAMGAAAQELFDKGIHDPDKVRDAKLKARERVKREHRDEQAKAARAAKTR
jgi:hypothetical protein